MLRDRVIPKELHRNPIEVQEQQSKIKGDEPTKYCFNLNITSIVYISISP